MKFLTLLGALLIANGAFAISVAVERRDMKFPSQVMVEKQVFSAPAASSSTAILNGHAGPTSAAATTISSGFTQPDMPRNLEITPGGTTADVGTCTIVVTGTDFFSHTITEVFAFANNATGKQVGNYAFKTVTSVAFAANCEDGGFAATWSIGRGEKLGVKRCMASAVDFIFGRKGDTKEVTAPTIASHISSVSANTVDWNSAMDGTSDFVLFFFQNFGCLP